MESSASKTAASTPSSSPGLFNLSPPQPPRQFSLLTDGPAGSPYLHPLQMHKVRETHKAAIEQDFITGRKLINQYEILEEIGRGVHGKVKLARSLETNELVAIKIIQRYSKKRRLGRATVSPESKTKREIAILKKIRHPNVVGLLEVIDDLELKKIYMVLEYVELGEIVWRKKGNQHVSAFERRRIEREIRGDRDIGDEERFFKMNERRRLRRDAQRSKLTQLQLQAGDFWSLEHGNEEDDFEASSLSRTSTHESMLMMTRSRTSGTSLARSNTGSRAHSRATSRVPSRTSSIVHSSMPADFDIAPLDSDNEDETPGPLPSIPSAHSSGGALNSHLNGSDDHPYRGRSPSMADSFVSNMSSHDDVTQHDAFEEDFSYVPCFTIDQARTTFRDTVLGLEYLHYQGVVHRDIKPANLLWTKDHRVKISDFGVSYFGKPVHSGETDDYLSGSDATDFDDDFELAKTVGTPAFFAPELCYTDLDIEQPKVTVQIDVWSLGVTLYCLIYARIPFLAEDEYQLFRTIAQQDVYIPRRRLKAVNPDSLGDPTSSEGIYRDDDELVMEDIDDELYDLLRRMLIKDPKERMTLREVKRHPWVLKGIDNIIGWLDDTDPTRKASGRKIQVDDRELERAVVPITILERARSAVKKAVAKVIGRSETSRRRAISSGTSSTGELSTAQSPSTPAKGMRRPSLMADESYFPIREPREHGDHPLAQSVAVSPEHSINKDDHFAEQFVDAFPQRAVSDPDLASRPLSSDRRLSTAASLKTIVPRGHGHTQSLVISPPVEEIIEEEYFPTFTDHLGGIIRSRKLHNTRSMELRAEAREENAIRAHSVDRVTSALHEHTPFATIMHEQHSPPMVKQPAELHSSPIHQESGRSTTESSPVATDHHFFGFRTNFLNPHNPQSMSSPNVTRQYAASDLEERPATANRVPEGQTPVQRTYPQSTAETFAKAQEQLARRQRLEAEIEAERAEERNHFIHSRQSSAGQSHTTMSDCPPSPDDELFRHKQEVATTKRAVSSTSMNSNHGVLQSTEVASPISTVTLSSSHLGSSRDKFFPSDPSLPTLISGASSVSADPEGEFLTEPGTVQGGDTPETLTPPSLSKQASHDDEAAAPATVAEDEDSDSDEGLTMGRAKSNRSRVAPPSPGKRNLVRGNTNASVGSTETAKKVTMTK